MALLQTEFKKGRAELVKLFGGNGNAITGAGIRSKIGEKEIKEIYSKGECELLETLDESGEHFKKSWQTRQTSHKKYDFPSLQAQSSLNVQKFYQDLIRACELVLKSPNSGSSNEMVPIEDLQDPDLAKGLYAHQKKIQTAVKAVVRALESNKAMKNTVKEELVKIKKSKNTKDIKKYIDDLLSQLNKNVEFVDTESKRIVKKADILADWTLLSAIPVDVLVFPTISIAVAATTYSMVGFGIGAGIVMLLILAAVVMYCANDSGLTKRLATIHVKRYETNVKTKLRDVIKEINRSEQFVRDYLKKNKDDAEDKVIINDEVKGVVNEFVKTQRSLWKPYTTVAGREYTEESKRAYGKHRSGIVEKRDNKQSTEIGSYKLAIANTYKNMESEFDT